MEAERPWNPEKATSTRYSLADPTIGVRDGLIHHASGKVRMVQTPISTDEKADRLFRRLYNEGLVLGKLLPSFQEAPTTRTFRVPNAARPLIYDSVSEAGGAFSYGDDQLFYDLGELLGRAQNIGITVESAIGRAVAFVEFTQPDEPRVLFQPGVEYRVSFDETAPNATDEYATRLAAEFGAQFSNVEQYFRMGMGEATAA